MRISDWSSDVCSSDLTAITATRCTRTSPSAWAAASPRRSSSATTRYRAAHRATSSTPRSEEHTSELQSLMRISYAVFCLKKKTKKIQWNRNVLTTHHNRNEDHPNRSSLQTIHTHKQI